MVQIAGSYKLEKNENFLDFLLKNNVPQEAAEKMNASKPKLTVQVDGNKITVDVEGTTKSTQVYVLGQEVEEDLNGIKLQSTATLDGNVLTIKSKNAEGKAGHRTYTFKDNEVEVKIHSQNGAEATRIYKRL